MADFSEEKCDGFVTAGVGRKKTEPWPELTVSLTRHKVLGGGLW